MPKSFVKNDCVGTCRSGDVMAAAVAAAAVAAATAQEDQLAYMTGCLLMLYKPPCISYAFAFAFVFAFVFVLFYKYNPKLADPKHPKHALEAVAMAA
jgi:hypothetical protein